MGKKLYSEESIQDIATAIREKSKASDLYTVAEMADAIRNIPSGGGPDVPDFPDLPDETFTGHVDADGLIEIGWT